MAESAIEGLPEEILLQIFNLLDSDPPSTRKNRHEPSLQLTTSSDIDLKSISRVSRKWRRIVLQPLFRHARMRLDATPRPKWEDCRGCLRYASEQWATGGNKKSRPSDIASYHTDDFIGGTVTKDHYNANGNLGTSSSLTWESRFFHRAQGFLHFFGRNDLAIESFVLYTGKLIFTSSTRYSHLSPSASDRYKASAVFWHRLFSTANPRRIVIMAPPAEVSYLSNISIDLSQEWAFTDMNLHILELEHEDSPGTRRVDEVPCDLTSLRHTPDGPEDIADGSLLKLRPWKHLGLNEGSFLSAYARYEYFERGPPSIIRSIKDCVTMTSRDSNVAPTSTKAFMSSLRSFAYTAILPFAAHVNFRGLYPQLEILDVQLAPHPEESYILNDKRRVGKAMLDDCWQEFITACRLITRGLHSHDIHRPGGAKDLKKFICRDKQYTKSVELREELDEEFVLLCMPVWVEIEEGVFVRLADKVEYATDADELW